MSNAHAEVLLEQGMLLCRFSYNKAMIEALKAGVPSAFRAWDPERKAWVLTPAYGAKFQELALSLLGVRVVLPRAAESETQEMTLEVRYIGRCRERGGGMSAAYGWWQGGWNVLLPEQVLREWAHDPYRPGERTTLYAVLGVAEDVAGVALRTAYRQLARAWHPDVCAEPDAQEQFLRIKEAYDILNDPAARARYDAGLKLQATVPQADLPSSTQGASGYRSLYNCGVLHVEGQLLGSRCAVRRILAWTSIRNAQGRLLVVGWPAGADTFTERWV
jgi:hypothetical protein